MIHLKYGNTNTYLLRGSKGNLLLDTDWAGTMPLFYKEIKRQGISIRDIDFVMATHYHPDHMGLIGELTEQGVKLLLLDVQKSFVHFSDAIFSRDRRLNYRPVQEENAFMIACRESRGFLKRLGIDGEIIETPSHSRDSVSLILDDGVCLTGDLEPYGNLAGYEENEMLQSDWEKIMGYRPKVIYFAHTNAISDAGGILQ